MTKIMPLTPPIRRGRVIGMQTAGPAAFGKAKSAGGYFDMLDDAQVLEHAEPLPHPAGHAANPRPASQRNSSMRSFNNHSRCCAN